LISIKLNYTWLVIRLIGWFLMPTVAIFQLYRGVGYWITSLLKTFLVFEMIEP